VPDEVGYQSKDHPGGRPEQFQSGSSERSMNSWKQLTRHYDTNQTSALFNQLITRLVNQSINLLISQLVIRGVNPGGCGSRPPDFGQRGVKGSLGVMGVVDGS